MPFIPHTEADIKNMLDAMGEKSIEALFDEIPKTLRIESLKSIPEGMTEMSLARLMQDRAAIDQVCLNFIGAGAYEHHIPSAVWEIASRGEWMTAYTPYQAEASQGTLQLLYEYQTMMARLMEMDVSNASLYDGASALAEAILMAARCHKSKKNARVLIPTTVHPVYRQVVKTIVQAQAIEIIEIPFNTATGSITLDYFETEYFDTLMAPNSNDEFTALVIPMPNFFGVLEDVHALTDWAHARNAMVIGLVNPISMSLLTAPGEWGKTGADIACGEGQPLGIPLASGGPYFGFLCCKEEFIRQLPGRLIGRTTDNDGNIGYTLTLQAREQHIRRAKATSNICTNQGLLVTAATIYMSILGASGLYKVAAKSHMNTRLFREKMQSLKNVHVLFDESPFFHEIILQFNRPVEQIIQNLAKQGIQAGFNLKPHYPILGEALLVCVTETKTEEDLGGFAKALQVAVNHFDTVC